MKQKDTIQPELMAQIDFVFDGMRQVIEQHPQDHAIINLKVKAIWDEFYEGLLYFLAQKRAITSALRKEYIRYSEQYFAKCREDYNSKPEHLYRIQLRPKTQFFDPPPRQILTTEERLHLGRQHFFIRHALKQYWVETQTYDLDQLWGNLYLSLIYCSGCYDLMQLVTIANTLVREIQGDQTEQCWKLYRADYKAITNPLMLHYRMPHQSYGNQIEDKVVYQWRHIWLNPYAQLFIQGIKQHKAYISQPQQAQDVLRVIHDSLKRLKSPGAVDVICKELKKLQNKSKKLQDIRTLTAFRHVHFGFEVDPDLSIDMCLNQVLQNKLKTVSLSAQDQRYAWLNTDRGLSVPSTVTNIGISPLKMEQPKIEVVTAHQQLKTIPFELLLFERSAEKKEKNKSRRKAETIKWLRWRSIQNKLQQQKIDAVGVEKNIIEAQLRLLTWVFDLKKRSLKMASIERYFISIAKDYLFHVYQSKHDFEDMTYEDHEDLYRELLNGLDERDEAQRERKDNKSYQSAAYAYKRLKSFHQVCMAHYAVPQVDTFRLNNFQCIQLCHAKLVSPSLFSQFMQQLRLQMQQCATVQEQEVLYQLQLMYLLAYRLGLRLNEVRGLTFNELICPELIWKDNPTGESVQIHISLRNNIYRRLKSKNAQRQLDLNAVFLPEEMDALCQYLIPLIRTLKEKNKHTPQLIFATNGEVISEHSIHQITQQLFDAILGEGHGYRFHNFRHSAANHLAIAWLGSKEMVMTYTDYGWKQVNRMRVKLFGASAMQHQLLIQHKWRLLADWMGHGSIEQTASHYLHVLDMLAIDRIYNTPCMMNPQILKQLVGYQGSEPVDLNRYIQSNKRFKLYHPALALVKTAKVSHLFQKPTRIQASAFTRIYQYIQHHQQPSDLWVRRGVWLAAKWIAPQLAKMVWESKYLGEDVVDPSNLIEFYDDVMKRGFDQQLLTPIHTLEKDHKISALFSLKTLINHATLRKNYLYFSYCLNEKKQPELPSFMHDFKEGTQHILPSYAVLESDEDIDVNQKSRQIKLRFLHKETNKNITRCVIFALLLESIQYDQLWE